MGAHVGNWGWTVFRKKIIGGGGRGGGRTRIAWPKATARRRVWEGDVPPTARSAKLKPYTSILQSGMGS